MRTFEETHPWLKFEFRSDGIGPRLWIALGEAQAMCEHIAGVPLKPATASSLHRLYLARGALATTAIEGNTLSEEEALRIVAGESDLPPTKKYLATEIKNIVAACNQTFERLQKTRSDELSVDQVMEFNRTVLRDLELQEGVVPGQIRTYSAGVPGYRGAPQEDCHHLLSRLCDWLNGPEFRSSEAPPITVAILKAVIAHIYLAWIHAFGDGNGRTARLVEVQILMAANVPTSAAHLLSNHYNKTRQEYYRRLRQASEPGGDLTAFIEYAVTGLIEELREHLETIRYHQWDVAWENFVYERFREKGKTPAGRRRRQLLLDLSDSGSPVPVPKLPDLSPVLARMYAGKTRKTIARDLNVLDTMGLIQRGEDGIEAKRELILAFLPGQPIP